jgi:hypothetical protein
MLLLGNIIAGEATPFGIWMQGWHERDGGFHWRNATPHESMLGIITRRRILYWLAAMVAVLVGGTIIGLIWADTSDVAGSIAVITNIVGLVGIVLLLIALAVVTRRRRQKLPA